MRLLARRRPLSLRAVACLAGLAATMLRALVSLLLVLAAAADDAGVLKSALDRWDSCGGVHGPNGKDTASAAGCPSGFACVRQDK